MPRVLFAARRAPGLAADAASFAAGTAGGTAIAALSNPFGGATSYAAVGTPPGQLALSGGNVVAGGAAASGGQSYAIKVRATSADGRREIAETLSFAAIGAVATGPALLAPGSRLVFAGDSKTSMTSSPSMRNFALATVERLSGALRLAIAGDQGIGGNTITDSDANPFNDLSHRLAFATGQGADATVIAIGHNAMAQAAATTIAQLQALHAQARAALGAVRLIVWTTILPSFSSDAGLFPVDNAKLVQVNDAIMALDGGDGGWTRAVNLTYRASDNGGIVFQPQTMCYQESNSGATQYIHPNERGAEFVAAILAPALAALAQPIGYAAALADTGAAREHGANLDAKYAMAGTGGTFAGSGAANCSGALADHWTLTNASAATVVCAKIDNGDGTFRQRITITGTGIAEGYVELKATNDTGGGRVNVNAAIGDVVEALIGFQIASADGGGAPAGLRQYGLVLPTTVASFARGTYVAAESNLAGAQASAIGPRVARVYPHAQQVALNTVLPGFGVRIAGTVSIRIDLERPIVRKTELTAYAAPAYVGGDGVKGAGERTAIVSGVLANGNAIVFQPGLFSGGALALAGRLDLSSDGGASWSPLVATLPANWTWTAGGLASGNQLRLTATATNAIGSATSTLIATVP